jgi:cytochrome c peroxidase
LQLLGCAEENPQASVPFAAIIEPANNPTTPPGIELGRTLFFDPSLSEDGTISCGSCHRPELAFTDGRRVSTGVYGRQGARNAPGLTNIGYFHRRLFWDGRAANLEEQALHPIGTPEEMGGSWPEVIARIQEDTAYVAAFREAFGTPAIDSLRVGRALAQYQRSLVSSDSKYDRVLRGEANYTERERLGHAIFFDLADDPDGPFAGLPKGECAHCHTPPHFSNLGFANNGLDGATELTDFPDPGRGAVTGRVYDNGLFRTPGLRNVARTAPYMHDGRFATLAEVVEHYDSGGHYAENRSPNIRRLGMNTEEKAALVAFLLTLTDTSFVSAR